MKNTSTTVSFSKVFLTSLFVGLIATMACLIYDIWYRMATYYGPSDFINVSTIIFIVNILLMIAGVVYWAFKNWSKNGDIFYLIFFLFILGFCFWKIIGIHRFPEIILNREFIQLLGGTALIIGIATLSVPLFYNNKKMTGFFYEEGI